MQISTRSQAAAALAGLAVIGGLAGCSAPAGQAANDDANTPAAPEAGAGTEYTDGEYTATGGYTSPGGEETVSVTLTLDDSVVTALDVTGSGSTPNSKKFQGEFIDNISDIVVGQRIDELNVSKVAGSSLTSGGFNAAIDEIKGDAD